MTTAVAALPLDQPARHQIRYAHDRTLFVEAGAGTGKTAALVARVVEMVATGALAGIDGLAAITFSENAAAELRNRLRTGLEQAARGNDRDRCYNDAEADRCRQAIRRFDDAAVTTLHSFAAGILKQYPVEAGLPPGFTVQDPIGARSSSMTAWRTFLDDLLATESVQRHLLAALTLDVAVDKLRLTADAFAGNWDLISHRPFAKQEMPFIDSGPILRPLTAAAAFADRGPAGDRLTDWLQEHTRPCAAELASLTEEWDILDAVNTLEFKPGLGNKQAWAAVGSSKDQVIALLRESDQAAGQLLEAVGSAVAQTLGAELQDYTLGLAAARRRDGELHFHDLLVLTRDLLRDNPQVRAALHRRYPVLLIDEFQDTDPLQVQIACLIAADPAATVAQARWQDLATRVPAGRLFFVGDPKQSIYRFRRADVTIFLEAGRQFSPSPTRLSVNFRSLPAVTDAVNAVFDTLMAGSGPNHIAYAALTAHRDHHDHTPVQLLGGPQEMRGDALRDAEAEHIAATIRTAKTCPWPVHDEQTSCWRPASYQDMAILLQTRRPLPALEIALQAQNIPYRIESRSLVWATDAVRDLITLLQCIDNPADEVATNSALHHPGLACSDVDLATWRAMGGGWNYMAPAPDTVADDHPVATGMATLRSYHDLCWWLPVNELVERIVRDLRLIELTAGVRRPRDHWRRLRFVVDQARAFCDAAGSGLNAFVSWAVEQIESDADTIETVVSEPDDDAVRILTVHGAKGLEFPIVILAGLGAPGRRTSDVLWDGHEPQVRLKGHVATTGFAAQALVDKAANADEALRLLYVAMTRARDHLVLGCYHRPTKAGAGSQAQQLWGLLSTRADLAAVHPVPPHTPPDSPPPQPASDLAGDAAGRDRFIAEREGLLHTTRRRVAVSATGSSDTAAPVRATPVATRRTPGKGAALGSSVHRVLELIDLAAGTTEDIASCTAIAADEFGVPELATQIAARVHGVLHTPVVTEAVATGRYWREVYVVAPADDRFVEGYIDLLVETRDGELVVVDYKTDHAATDVERAVKAAHYRPQLVAYARAVASATSRPVTRGYLIFAGTENTHQVQVDLRATTHDETAADRFGADVR